MFNHQLRILFELLFINHLAKQWAVYFNNRIFAGH